MFFFFGLHILLNYFNRILILKTIFFKFKILVNFAYTFSLVIYLKRNYFSPWKKKLPLNFLFTLFPSWKIINDGWHGNGLKSESGNYNTYKLNIFLSTNLYIEIYVLLNFNIFYFLNLKDNKYNLFNLRY